MNLKALGLIAAVAVLVPVAIHAQGRHAHYMQARSDLRSAQFFMRVREEPNVTRKLGVADQETEAAIREIDRAAVVDRKDMNDHPPIDASLARKERFRKIVDLLRSARADIDREEDNPRAREWRDVAFRHIDEALNAVHRAAVDARLDHELGF